MAKNKTPAHAAQDHHTQFYCALRWRVLGGEEQDPIKLVQAFKMGAAEGDPDLMGYVMSNHPNVLTSKDFSIGLRSCISRNKGLKNDPLREQSIAMLLPLGNRDDTETALVWAVEQQDTDLIKALLPYIKQTHPDGVPMAVLVEPVLRACNRDVVLALEEIAPPWSWTGVMFMANLENNVDFSRFLLDYEMARGDHNHQPRDSFYATLMHMVDKAGLMDLGMVEPLKHQRGPMQEMIDTMFGFLFEHHRKDIDDLYKEIEHKREDAFHDNQILSLDVQKQGLDELVARAERGEILSAVLDDPEACKKMTTTKPSIARKL